MDNWNTMQVENVPSSTRCIFSGCTLGEPCFFLWQVVFDQNTGVRTTCCNLSCTWSQTLTLKFGICYTEVRPNLISYHYSNSRINWFRNPDHRRMRDCIADGPNAAHKFQRWAQQWYGIRQSVSWPHTIFMVEKCCSIHWSLIIPGVKSQCLDFKPHADFGTIWYWFYLNQHCLSSEYVPNN
jgi:hypothetical protein